MKITLIVLALCTSQVCSAHEEARGFDKILSDWKPNCACHAIGIVPKEDESALEPIDAKYPDLKIGWFGYCDTNFEGLIRNGRVVDSIPNVIYKRECKVKSGQTVVIVWASLKNFENDRPNDIPKFASSTWSINDKKEKFEPIPTSAAGCGPNSGEVD